MRRLSVIFTDCHQGRWRAADARPLGGTPYYLGIACIAIDSYASTLFRVTMPDMNMQPSAFEDKVTRALLVGDFLELEQLRAQYMLAQVSQRDFTGSGAFVSFHVPPNVERCQPPDFHFGDLRIQLQGTSVPAEAILWIKDGVLHELEYYLYGSPWPDEPEIVTLSYFGEDFTPDVTDEKMVEYRDFEMVQAQIGYRLTRHSKVA